MRLLKRLLARLRNLASRQSDDQRFLEEMEEHLSRQTEENLRSGMTRAEARRQAVLKFGAVEAIREQYHAEKSLPFIESFVQDVRYSSRILRKSWGFTINCGNLSGAGDRRQHDHFFGHEAPVSRPARGAPCRATPPTPLAWRPECCDQKHVGNS